MMVDRVGQQSALETKAFEKLMPLFPNTERVFGMYLRSSLRMSSARMKTILGLAVAPSASRAALSQTPDTSSTAKATATDNITVLLMSNTPLGKTEERKVSDPRPGYSNGRSIACSLGKAYLAKGRNGVPFLDEPIATPVRRRGRETSHTGIVACAPAASAESG